MTTLRSLNDYTLAEFMALPVNVRRAVAEAYGLRYLGGPRFRLAKRRASRPGSRPLSSQRKVQS